MCKVVGVPVLQPFCFECYKMRPRTQDQSSSDWGCQGIGECKNGEARSRCVGTLGSDLNSGMHVERVWGLRQRWNEVRCGCDRMI